jgi:penicillin-binding protein 1A
MDTILVKILAAFLALSQVTTRPDAVRTQFDPARDRAVVMQIMRAGCSHMRKAFDVESLDLDDLITTAMDDPAAVTNEIKGLQGLKFDSLVAVYHQLCKNEDREDSPVHLDEVIRFFNSAAVDLPDHTRLRDARNAGAGGVLDARGEHFADLTESNRRIWVPLKEIPISVQKAFVAAEDKRFYEHKGIDEHGLIRAMVANLAQPGRPQGGSTITQQVVKNLLVGDDVTYERKIREIILAARIERALTKPEILELYLNSIFLGRGAWGIELAARNYFGKPASALTLQEGALLAGLTRGPTNYGPDRHPDRAKERLAYVLDRMQEDGDAGAAALDATKVPLPQMVAYEHVPHRGADSHLGHHFLDHMAREARAAGIGSLATASTIVRTTIRPDLQRATEAALQEGLAQYEIGVGRVEWHGPEANLADAVSRLDQATDAPTIAVRPGSKPKPEPKPIWQRALESAQLPLHDVHWPPAIVLSTGAGRGGAWVGLSDGRVLPLSTPGFTGRLGLSLYDVVFVKLGESRSRQPQAELRVRPTVQGAAIALDNHTGGILAMAGGFSYPISQLNRATQAQRQPGSLLKPFTYLAALHNGLQPNTLVPDKPLTLPPLGNPAGAREQDYWSPKNADGIAGGLVTLRQGLENSLNLVTANLLNGGIAAAPSDSLAQVCGLAIDAQIYHDCVAYYPFILGAQPARLVDLAAFYAAVATEGRRPSPHAIESIEQNGRTVYVHKAEPKWLASADRAAFFQLRTMLQGVVARGTARAIGNLSAYVGGKTGTSDNENDAWFIGFSNDVTIGVWVGYDNADGIRRTLGNDQAGARVAVPIFEPIMQAVWTSYASKSPLNPPSLEARKELVALTIDINSGNRVAYGTPQAFTEYFRIRGGQWRDTQYRLVGAGGVAAGLDRRNNAAGDDGRGDYAGSRYTGENYQRGWNGGRPFGNGQSPSQVWPPRSPTGGQATSFNR